MMGSIRKDEGCVWSPMSRRGAAEGRCGSNLEDFLGRLLIIELAQCQLVKLVQQFAWTGGQEGRVIVSSDNSANTGCGRRKS